MLLFSDPPNNRQTNLTIDRPRTGEDGKECDIVDWWETWRWFLAYWYIPATSPNAITEWFSCDTLTKLVLIYCTRIVCYAGASLCLRHRIHVGIPLGRKLEDLVVALGMPSCTSTHGYAWSALRHSIGLTTACETDLIQADQAHWRQWCSRDGGMSRLCPLLFAFCYRFCSSVRLPLCVWQSGGETKLQ